MGVVYRGVLEIAFIEADDFSSVSFSVCIRVLEDCGERKGILVRAHYAGCGVWDQLVLL